MPAGGMTQSIGQTSSRRVRQEIGELSRSAAHLTRQFRRDILAGTPKAREA